MLWISCFRIPVTLVNNQGNFRLCIGYPQAIICSSHFGSFFVSCQNTTQQNQPGRFVLWPIKLTLMERSYCCYTNVSQNWHATTMNMVSPEGKEATEKVPRPSSFKMRVWKVVYNSGLVRVIFHMLLRDVFLIIVFVKCYSNTLWGVLLKTIWPLYKSF